MEIHLKQQTVQALNLQYKTNNFSEKMTPRQMVECSEYAMRSSMDIIDYELNNNIIERYGIKVHICEEDPFTIQERSALEKLIEIVQKLISCSTADIVCKQLENLNQLVTKSSLKLQISERYHKYKLYFKYVTIKEALIFESLRGCQVFYTITKERRKSGKEYFMDPLINFFQGTAKRLQISFPFHQKLMNRRQVRHIEKRSTAIKMKNSLFEAVSQGNVQQARELIDNGMPIESPGIFQDGQLKREMNCSHRACQLGNLQMCRMLDSYNVNWQARDRQAYTPLHYAVQSNNIEVVSFLVEQVKVDKQAKNNQGRSAFYIACKVDGLDMIKYLAKCGCDVNTKTKLGRTALAKACYLGYLDIATFLLSCPEVIMQVQDSKQRTPLYNSAFGPKGRRQDPHLGVNEKDSPQCTQLLLKYGASVDYRDEKLNTPLHVSASSDGVDSIKILIKYGASLDKLNKYSQTPLMTAAKFGHPTTVKMLHEQYGASLTRKDNFDKNLILLCTMFRQQDRIHVNKVFHYVTDRLLQMAKENKPLEEGEYCIDNWQKQIDYTFGQLLKNHYRSDIQFKYFSSKSMELGLKVENVELKQVQQLLTAIVYKEEREYYQFFDYFILKQKHLKTTKRQFEQFTAWILQENNPKLLEYISQIEQRFFDIIDIQHQNLKFSFERCMEHSFWQLLPQLKEKVITLCLMKFNINWLDYFQNQRGYNILHLLVRYKKLGTLIQVLKMLSGSNVKYVTNQHVLKLIKIQQNVELLSKMLSAADNQGFDPYNLALLLKDAPSAKLLEEHIKNQLGQNKIKYEVRQYSLTMETDPEELQKYIKGYNLQPQLQSLTKQIEECESFQKISQLYPFIIRDEDKFDLIDHQQKFNNMWKSINQKQIIYISKVEQIPYLYKLEKQPIIGLDIEYFHCQGAIVISIMQISTMTDDYILDFLLSANKNKTNYPFITGISKLLISIAQNQKITKVMHGSDNDLYILRSVLRLNFVNFIDTARLDMQITQKNQIRGLSTLVQQYLKQTMNKDYQISQWKIRPLPTSMLDYARKDSLVLPYLTIMMLNLAGWNKLKNILINGCLHAKRNKKTNQPLIKSIQSV